MDVGETDPFLRNRNLWSELILTV